MCPPWIEGAHAGAPLQMNYSYFYERNLVLLQIILQGLFQELPGPFEQAVHRLGAEAHFLADLLVGEPGEALQDQGPALVFGEGVQELLQPAAQVLLLQGLQGRGPGDRPGWERLPGPGIRGGAAGAAGSGSGWR